MLLSVLGERGQRDDKCNNNWYCLGERGRVLPKTPISTSVSSSRMISEIDENGLKLCPNVSWNARVDRISCATCLYLM